MDNAIALENTNNAPKIHIFQGAGLGAAPYRLTHVTSEGGACEYCGTAIIFRFHLRGSDGRTFYVGSDCVMKTGDAGLMRVVEHEVKKRMAELRTIREKAKMEALREHLAKPEVIESLKSQAHPFMWHAKQGKSMYDYVEWTMRWGGATAKGKLHTTFLGRHKRAKKAAEAQDEQSAG